MKLPFKNPSKKGSKIIGKTVILFSLIVFAVSSAQAQSINDDLKPKKAPAKSASQPKTKTVRPRTKPIPRRPTSRSTYVPRENTAAVTLPSQPAQTPAQIIERFMNFQQSAGVNSSDWQSVVTQASAALQSNPNDTTAKAQLFLAQGQLAYSRNDFSNALIQFNGAAQALPDSALPHYGIGNVYLSTKQPNEAKNAFEKAVKLNKNFALAYKGLGDVMTAQKNVKKADEYYRTAARVGLSGGNPTSVNSASANNVSASGSNTTQPQSGSPNVAPESEYDREMKSVKQLIARKKWQNALDKLLPLMKTNSTADLYVLIGDSYFGLKQWLSAQQSYRKATEISPNSALAYFKTGMVLFQMNEYQAASEAFEKSLILDQTGVTINRPLARKMADSAGEKARGMKGEGKKRKFLGIG